MTEATIVKNSSQGYGYKYSSLADLAKAGIKIPKMRISSEHPDFLEYQDEDGTWHMGSKIVVPEMKSCNEAQAYGSALTYARRYTVQMAMCVACDDDDAIEAAKPTAQTAQNRPQSASVPGIIHPATDKQKDAITAIMRQKGVTQNYIEMVLNKCITSTQASKAIGMLKEGKQTADVIAAL